MIKKLFILSLGLVGNKSPLLNPCQRPGVDKSRQCCSLLFFGWEMLHRYDRKPALFTRFAVASCVVLFFVE